jgi:hypothetical protein
MIKREQVESILRINGVEPTSPDEQIRSVLLSARYSQDEVDTAIMVLRENTKTNKTRVDGLHKVFRSEESLSPNEISALLGIDVEVEAVSDPQEKARALSSYQYVLLWIFSLMFAMAGIAVYMYLHKIGIFHPTVGFNVT